MCFTGCRLKLALLAALSAFALVGSAHAQSVGVEREVQPGIYLTLVEIKDGWRLWRYDTSTLTYCHAVKPSVGKRSPMPLGTGFYSGSYPYFEIRTDPAGRASWSMGGRFPGFSIMRWRQEGERFFKTAHSRETNDPTGLDGKVLDAVVTTWEDEILRYNETDVRGKFDLTSMADMQAKVVACRKDK